MEDHPDHVFYNLSIDAGSIGSRCLIDATAEAERPTPGAAGKTIPLRRSA